MKSLEQTNVGKSWVSIPLLFELFLSVVIGKAEKERLPAERRDTILNYFPKFLADLQQQLLDDASPVWNPAFQHRPPAHCLAEEPAAAAAAAAAATTGVEGPKRTADAEAW